MLSVGHQRWSQSYLRVASFFGDIFWQFASSNFVISVSKSFEAYNASFHFVHQHCCLLVTKDGHSPFFTSQVFSLTSFWHFASSNFVNSVLRIFEAYKASNHFIHQECCLLVIKNGQNLIFASQVFRWHLSQSSLLGTSWFLLHGAFKCIMLLSTLFINTVVCCSPKMVTILSLRRKFSRRPLSDNSLLGTSWFLLHGAFKCIMLLSTLFINTVVCWSSNMVTILSLRRRFFSLTSFSQFTSSNFVNFALRRSEVCDAFYIFFINNVVFSPADMVTTMNLALQLFLVIFLEFASNILVNFALESSEVCGAFYHFSIYRVVCWSPMMVTILSSHRKFFCWHLSDNSLLATSWILFY